MEYVKHTKRLLALVAIATASATAQNLGQNWSAEIARQFWVQDQGSKLMRQEIFMALRKPDGTLLKDDLASFGFIPGALSQTGLPIGFAIHKENGKNFVGLTCSACHTALWKTPTAQALVEGGPSMLDFDAFFTATVSAVRDACSDGNKFKSLGQNAVSYGEFCQSADSPKNVLEKRLRMNKAPVAAGFGRVDAFAEIFNQISVFVLGNAEKYAVPPVAPASYPCLWDISQMRVVQWNGSAPNLGLEGTGAKLRNVGELLGVFGEVDFKPANDLAPNYHSSVNAEGLIRIEKWISQLYSPAWPGNFPAIDTQRRDRGKSLYEGKADCARCHMVLRARGDRTGIEANVYPMDEVRTEPILADQFRLNVTPSGALTGKFKMSNPRLILGKFDPIDRLGELTAYVTFGALNGTGSPYAPTRTEMVSDLARTFWTGPGFIDGYKARPLDGIWATAPYLHNGSVPNLNELLTRAKYRQPAFCVGTREFDAVNVGYAAAPCADATGFLLETGKAGNGNEGHEFGVDLTPEEKKDLIEYLKSL